MLGATDDDIATLTKVLDLLLETERELEPWISDIICDNVSLAIKSCSSIHDLQESLAHSIQAIIDTDISNVKLRLRIISIAFPMFDFKTEDVFPHLESYPGEVFQLWALMLTADPESSIKRLTRNDDEFSRLISKVRECSKSLYVPVKRAAGRLMAKYCIASHKPLSWVYDLEETLHRFHPDFLCEILNEIYTHKDIKAIALSILETPSVWRVLSGQKVEQLNKLMAYKTAGYLISHPTQIAEHLIDHPDYSTLSIELHVQVFYRELVELLVFHDIQKMNDIVEEIVQILFEDKNIMLVSAASKPVKDDKLWKKCFGDQMVTMGFMLDAMECIYDECAVVQAKRCVVSILEDIAHHGALWDILERCDTCIHMPACTHKGFLCFTSSYLTHLSECSIDSFAMLANFTPKLLNEPHFVSHCSSLQPQLISLLTRKLSHGNARVRDLVLDVVGEMEQRVIDPSVLDQVLLLCYSDDDYYVRSSCFKVLSRCSTKNLPEDLAGDVRVKTLNNIIRNIEYDDSIVTISFFGFLVGHFHLIGNIIREHTEALSVPALPETVCSNHGMADRAHASRDIDAVIDEVCNSVDCGDVSLISAYKDRSTDEGVSDPKSELVRGVFRLLGLDRCDVERMKASLQLVTIILRSLDETKKREVIDYLQKDYFNLVESFNSPFLCETIRELNTVLNGARTFSELKCRKNQNLMTVLTLLQSTPDPDIVMDCY